VTPGDIFVCHSPGWGGRLIGLGERLRRLDGHFTHAGVLVGSDGSTVEAEARGVVRSNLSAHPGAVVLKCPAGVDRDAVVSFALAQVGDRYDFDALILLGIDCLLPTNFHDTDRGVFFCSELAATALAAGGWKSLKPPSATYPADLYKELQPLAT